MAIEYGAEYNDFQLQEHYLGKHFTSSSEVFSWLAQFINLESGLIPPKIFRLESMAALSELAGHPDRCAPSIHVAGSKGKGSVTGMIASVLEADGRRAARYMSPHISDFRERICLGNSFFDESVYCAAGDELRDLAENRVPASKNSLFDPDSGGEAPTFFELLTMYFFLCARAGGCDVMVVETGLGGRLDSTNILDPLVSIITLIELEHTAFLGNTLAEVAGEKAGIIKSARPLILARQSDEALEVFKKRAAEKNSPLFYYPENVSLENLEVHHGGTDFSLTLHSGVGPAPPPRAAHPTGESTEPPGSSLAFQGGNALHGLSIPIPGVVQAENAALAVLALRIAFPGIGSDAIRRGLEQVKIPARFEKIPAVEGDRFPLIIDGAHTPESAFLCAETFCSLYGEGGLLLFACAADKNVCAMAEILLPRFSRIIVTTPGTFKISEPEKAYRAFAGQCNQGFEKTRYIQDTGEAIRQTLREAQEKQLPVLCMGSFYLASEVWNYVMKAA